MYFQPESKLTNTSEKVASMDVVQESFSQNLCGQRLQGGYVEFSYLEQTYVHFFTCQQALAYMRSYIQAGKPLEGLRNYLHYYYLPHVLGKTVLTNEPVIIWNYEFDKS
jgi:hypothetical protein